MTSTYELWEDTTQPITPTWHSERLLEVQNMDWWEHLTSDSCPNMLISRWLWEGLEWFQHQTPANEAGSFHVSLGPSFETHSLGSSQAVWSGSSPLHLKPWRPSSPQVLNSIPTRLVSKLAGTEPCTVKVTWHREEGEKEWRALIQRWYSFTSLLPLPLKILRTLDCETNLSHRCDSLGPANIFKFLN